MGRVVPYRRRNRTWRPSQSRRQRAAKSLSPFTPLYLLVIVSGLAWLGYDRLVDAKTEIARLIGADTIAACGSFGGSTCVVDGDTIEHHGQRIRLLGINTPEIFDYKCEHELRLGLKARQRLIELLNEAPFDIVPAGGRDRDAFGRLLRDVERDGYSLGNTLVAEGLAHRWNGYRQSWCG